MSVAVEQYNPAWPSYFEQIRSELEEYLQGASIVTIEHVGSTSVPGLAAKPIIDIDIIVTRENVQPAIDALVVKGSFIYLGELGIVDRHALKDPNQSPQRNIYVCVEGAFQTRNHLAVRDTLRTNSALRDEYGAVKLALGARGTNIIDYIEAKGPIVQKILKEAGLLNREELEIIERANHKAEIFGATKTERLTLREFVYTDIDGLYDLESQEEVVKYQTFEPWTREEARKAVVKIIQNATKLPRTHFELAVTHGDKFIGRVGANLKRETEDGKALSQPHADLWVSFLPEYHGRGYATEAMQAFIGRLSGLLGSPFEFEIETDPRNTGSWKLAERLGFERVSFSEKAFQSKGEWVDSVVYQKAL